MLRNMFTRITPMQTALGVSVLLHVGLLLFRIADPQGFDRLMTQMPLDIVLVNARSNAGAPDKPQALAQAKLQGGGEVANGRAQSALPLSERNQTGQADDATSAKLRQLKQQQTAMLAQVKKQLSINNAKQAATASEAAEQEHQRRQLMDLLAEIEQRINEQNARPRTRYVSPSTREVSYALYHDHMRRLIEERGTRLFPQAQGRKLYGSLTLLLTVNAQGRVIDSRLLKSSGQPELDKQALVLATEAGPFGAFTADMKREFDQLAMVSRYTFKRNLTVQADNPDQ